MDQHRLEIDGLNDYMDQRVNGPTDQKVDRLKAKESKNQNDQKL